VRQYPASFSHTRLLLFVQHKAKKEGGDHANPGTIRKGKKRRAEAAEKRLEGGSSLVDRWLILRTSAARESRERRPGHLTPR
jgi:hypothetical protein